MNYGKEVEKKTMRVKEFAEAYGIGMNNAYQIIHAQGFPKIMLGKKILIITSKVDEWIENNIGRSF